MKIRENHHIILEKHPYAEFLNKDLMAESQLHDNEINSNYTNLVGKKISTSKSNDAPSKLIGQWIVTILKDVVHNSPLIAETISYDVSMWFAIYDEGDYAKSHHHIPYSLWSFVYYVNTPKGSSPLVFTTSGKKIKAEEGKLVLFPAGIRHHVPKNRCKNRLVLAGNLIPFRG